MSLPAISFAGETDRCASPGLQFRILKNCDGTVTRYMVENREIAPITVTFELDQQNLKSALRFPHTQTLPPNQTTDVFLLSPVKEGEPWRYSLTYHGLLGSQSAAHESKCVYSLPYASGQSFKVSQAYHGTFSHTGPERYAIDWRMPSGTAVLAARCGKVVAIKEDSQIGGADKKFLPHANYILIEHRDGTIANYAHLLPGSARVKMGQTVNAGEVIGLSGNTGYSSGPHLHFCVFKTKDGKERESLPVQFRTVNAPAVTLLSGQAYQAPETLLAVSTPSTVKLMN
jgi:murein DD-endopeptidase MepM/ murein hydrolase activator NlpD